MITDDKTIGCLGYRLWRCTSALVWNTWNL